MQVKQKETQEEQDLNEIISAAGEQSRQEFKNARNAIKENIKAILG